MQLASSGLRAVKGAQVHLISRGGQSARSIHIPAFARPASQSTTSVTQAIIRHARTAVSRFVAHLTAPSTLRSPAHLAAGTRPTHLSSIRIPTIQQRLSFPARQYLSQPLSVPFLPRPPGLPRHISQVGLGIARNFSTTRPIFQHLVENVPVYARAFSEVDWEIRIQKERERLRKDKTKAKRTAKDVKRAKASLSDVKISIITPQVAVVESEKADLDHYFPEAATPEVTTHLLIPLAPTPTARLPLPLDPLPTPPNHPLLPLDVIASMHASHGTHALRVSTLFARLDTARVFDDPGVFFEARGDMSGLCTVLEVRFEGWTKNKVRGVLGEAGTGWCVLEEVWREQERLEAEEMDDSLDALSISDSATPHHIDMAHSQAPGSDVSWGSVPNGIDPARSFVLPTLDFSASFPVPSWSPDASTLPAASLPPPSNLDHHNPWLQRDSRASSQDNWWYDDQSDTESTGDRCNLAGPPSAAERSFVFSSRFSEEMEGSDGPRDEEWI